ENLTLLGGESAIGNALDNIITGSAGDNSLNGGDGDDTLIGGDGNDALNGAAGVDTMFGGAGDDQYFYNDASDTIVEYANEGLDTVLAMGSYTLSDNVESLILIGSANADGTGNALDNNLNGNAFDNVLDGGLGVDFMNG